MVHPFPLLVISSVTKYNLVGTLFELKEPEPRDTGVKLIIDLIVVLALVIVAGIMSGLTLGLLSLDTVNLEIIINAGSEKDAANARKYTFFSTIY
jgi:hypothetical protein